MEDSYIYDLMEHTLINKWREEIESKDEYEFGKTLRECEQAIKQTLNEKQTELLKFFEVSVHNFLNNVFYEINKKVLNFGIRTGMQLQRAFYEQEKQ